MKCYEGVIIIISCFTIASSLSGSNETQLSGGVPVEVPAEKYFLDYIFNKYGSNGKMSYEGFEHLLDSLGLGRLKFSHKLEEHKKDNGTFQEVHDALNLHMHNHLVRRRRSIEAVKRSEEETDAIQNLYKKGRDHCYTPEEMLKIYKFQPNHQLGLSTNNFLHICPILVYQLDQKSCVLGQVAIEPNHSEDTEIYIVWLLALSCVLFISLVGLIGISIVPFLQRIFFKEILGFLMALAVGTLCGDALLHLLPHALQKQDDESPNNVVLRAGLTFMSILLFYCLGNFVHSHEHESNSIEEKNEFMMKSEKDKEIETGAFIEKTHSHAKSKTTNMSIAYMVIMGDGLHNLTDGLAIGAAFSGDVVSGITTAIAVFTHELPHELGDFAVLLKVGMTVKQAVFYNIISSILSFVGVAIGLLLTNFTYASLWIYSITAGVFMYIALVNLIPELKRSTDNSLGALCINIAGLLSGGGIMFLIALYEDSLENFLLN